MWECRDCIEKTQRTKTKRYLNTLANVLGNGETKIAQSQTATTRASPKQSNPATRNIQPKPPQCPNSNFQASTRPENPNRPNSHKIKHNQQPRRGLGKQQHKREHLNTPKRRRRNIEWGKSKNRPYPTPQLSKRPEKSKRQHTNSVIIIQGEHKQAAN